ncbi:6-hydroxy-3-succinoylpyridine 3-monooxygenase HspA, partial [termite gut metagenome]
PTIISVDLRNNMKAHKGKVVFLENNKNKFINSVMSNDVIKDGKTYSIPPKWKIGE